MEFNIDYIISERERFRKEKNYEMCDLYRNMLEEKNVFINDTKDGQEVWFLPEKYFIKKPNNFTNKEFWQLNVKKDKNADNNFSSWLFSMQQSMKSKKNNLK